MLSSIISLTAILFLVTFSGSALTKERNPCHSDGTLKGWAIKQGYTTDSCSATGDSGGTDDSGSVGSGGGGTPCEGATLKGWARKAGYDQAICLSETPTPNTNPTIVINSPSSGLTIEEGTTVSFSATATDAEDGDLSGSVLWGSSLDNQIGSSANLSIGTHTITARVTDSAGASTEAQTSMTVTEVSTPNAAPTIVVTSPSDGLVVEEGTVVSFSANANDAEDGNLGDSVTWISSLDEQITNSTILSVGVHTIRAEVSDSLGVSADAEVVIEVTAKAVEPELNTVTMTWQAPITREDGTALEVSEIGGYEIYMIDESTGEENVFTINIGTLTTHTVNDLMAGVYHFSISAFDTSGVYSVLADPVTATIQ